MRIWTTFCLLSKKLVFFHTHFLELLRRTFENCPKVAGYLEEMSHSREINVLLKAIVICIVWLMFPFPTHQKNHMTFSEMFFPGIKIVLWLRHRSETEEANV